MRRILLLMLLSLSITCLAQKKEKRKGIYSARLISVETSKNVKLGTVDTVLSIYQDSIIKINWDYARAQINFELTNKSDQTLKIIWDDAALITITNESEKIFHKGIKYIDREQSQSPTSIYKGTTLSELVAPISYVKYTSGQYGGWSSRSIIPANVSIWSGKVDYDKELINRTIKVILPIKKEDQTLEYTFNFKTEFLEEIKK